MDNILGHICCRWGDIEFPLPFGRVMSATESFIHGLDEKVSKYAAGVDPCRSLACNLISWQSSIV